MTNEQLDRFLDAQNDKGKSYAEAYAEAGESAPDPADFTADAISARLGTVSVDSVRFDSVSPRALTAPNGEEHAAITQEIGRPEDQDLNGIPMVR